MATLLPCPTCGAHRRADRRACPHCGGLPARPLSAGELRTGAALLLALGAAACDGGNSQLMYGIPITETAVMTDEDGDGYTLSDDCDDDDANVHPGATETPGDAVDSNCDGQDDT